MNKTAKQRLSQAEIDSLVQQAAAKKQSGARSGFPAPRVQKQEARPTVDSRRQPEAAASSTDSAQGKPGQTENQRQTSEGTQEQLHGQQTQGTPAIKADEPQSAPKSAELPAKSEGDPGQDERRGGAIIVSSSPQHGHLELEQHFWLGGEGTSDLQADGVMIVLNRKLFKLG